MGVLPSQKQNSIREDFMPSPQDYKAIRQVLENYIAGSYTADTNLLKSLFHDEAMMSGFIGGSLDIGTPQPFYDELDENPSAKESGEDYSAEITFIHIAGDMASTGIVEDNLLGVNYVNHFHLLKMDGEWKIVNKIYTEVS